MGQVVGVLRANGWLQDGSLDGIDLSGANFHGMDFSAASLGDANLRWVNFQMTNLSEANLSGAQLQETRNLTDEQLAQLGALHMARLTDGSLYDGRFNLIGDLQSAQKSGVDIEDAVAMASFYGVELESYQRGQEWSQMRVPASQRV